MDRLRTHIARLIVAVFVCTGLSLYMVQPSQAEQSSQAFTSWLSNMATTSGGIQLQKELDDLQNSGDHLDQLIKKASEIVSSNNHDFDFLFTESIASTHLYHLLLIEWSQFQTGNAMAGVPTLPTAKLLVPTVDKTGSVGSAIVLPANIEIFFGNYELLPNPCQVFSMMLDPMAGGIAIGAP